MLRYKNENNNDTATASTLRLRVCRELRDVIALSETKTSPLALMRSLTSTRRAGARNTGVSGQLQFVYRGAY